MSLSDNYKPVVNPSAVLREEFDDWAMLVDIDSGDGFGLNPISVFVWKRLDGKHTVQDIASELRANCKNVPDEVEEHIREFIQDLLGRGLVGDDGLVSMDA